MKSSALSFVFTAAACIQAVAGLFPPVPRMEPFELHENDIKSLLDTTDPITGQTTFEQYIDHNDPKLGTFQQAFWWNATYWKGPGSPIIMMTPGESAAAQYTGYLGDKAILGMYAKAVGGAVVMVEHRYWGNSTPFEVQTTKNLQYLTLEQTIADFVRFARSVELPFDTSGKTNAPNAPWVFVGGSYPGALAAWIERLAPGTFWALHGSSGPVQAIEDYWQYFYPIQDGMPKNCSKDFEAVIEHVDDVFINGSDEDKKALKEMFAIQDLEHDDDAASAISSPIWAWQSIQMDSGYSQFFQMCDAIEGVAPNKTATYGASGVGLETALPNYAKWFTTAYLPGWCDSYGYSDWSGEMNVQCFNTYNGSQGMFADWSADNTGDRTWVWFTCNEPLDYWQTGAPAGTPTVFSRLANAEYYQRQCELFFPQEGDYTYGSKRGRTVDDVNKITSGWENTKTTRLLVSNGEYDPWRSASVSSVFRPDGSFNGTDDAPVILIEGSRHCNDLLRRNQVHEPIKQAMEKEISIISGWVADFYKADKVRRTPRGDLGKRSDHGLKLDVKPWDASFIEIS